MSRYISIFSTLQIEHSITSVSFCVNENIQTHPTYSLEKTCHMTNSHLVSFTRGVSGTKILKTFDFVRNVTMNCQESAYLVIVNYFVILVLLLSFIVIRLNEQSLTRSGTTQRRWISVFASCVVRIHTMDRTTTTIRDTSTRRFLKSLKHVLADGREG